MRNMRFRSWLTLLVLAALTAQAWGLSNIARRKTYASGEIFTAANYNADLDHWVTAINLLNAKFPGETITTTTGAIDTLASSTLGKVMVKVPLVSLAPDDSLFYHLARIIRLNVSDTLAVGGSIPATGGFRVAFTAGVRGRANLFSIDSLRIVDSLDIAAGAKVSSRANIKADSLSVGSAPVVGFRVAFTAGIRGRENYTDADTLVVRETASLLSVRRISAKADSATTILQDTTLSVSGKRVIEGSLHSDQFNCVNAVLRGNSYDCAGSYELGREKEKLTSYHNASRGDSGNVFPAEFRIQITTGSDSLVITDVLRGTMWAAVVKGANNACGNVNFNDVDFDDYVISVATAGGVCQIDLLTDAIWLYSTSGVGKYQGTFQTRNSALGTTTYNASPAIVSNTVNGVSVIRDSFGKWDGLGRLAQRWLISTGAVGSNPASIYDPWTNSIWDYALVASSSTTKAVYLAGGGVAVSGWTASIDYPVLWKYSGMSVTADAFNENEAYSTSGTGAEDLAWAVKHSQQPIFAVVERASIAGNMSPVFAVGSTSGAYFLHAKANDNTNGIKIRVTNSYIAPPEFGDARLAWPGTSSADASPYNNALTAVGSPGYNTTGSSSIVFSGAMSSTSNSYLVRTGDTDFNLGNDAAFSINLAFKSQSATNPSAAETLLDMSDATDNDQVHIFFATDGTITARVTDDARANYDSVDPAGDYYDATWHHYSFVFDGTTFRLYIDHVLAGSTAQSNINASVDPTEVWIGASYAASQFFNGHLAQVSISGSRAVTATEASWLASRMFASLQVNPNGRKLHALDVDYVQPYGNYVVMGDEDSCIVWDAVLGLPLPNRRYGSPNGTIQDAALRSVGGDSLGITLVTTTRTQQIVPDVRVLDLASRSFPFVQPGIGERVVVDSAGVAGLFWTPNDAFAAAKNARRGSIFIAAGTQPVSQVLSQDSLTVECANPAKTIFDGGITSVGLYVTGGKNTITNCGARTTAGGGSAWVALRILGADNAVIGCHVWSSDSHGFVWEGPRCRFADNHVHSADLYAGFGNDNGDDSSLTGNIFENGGSGSLDIEAACENIIWTGNRLDGASNDLSGTSIGGATLNDESSF